MAINGQTMYETPPYSINMGWQCPVCGRVNAPWVAHCPCSPTEWTIPCGPTCGGTGYEAASTGGCNEEG